MQMPHHMHSAKSMANRSSTCSTRGRPRSVRGGTVSLCESISMHQSGHSRAHTMHTVQFSSSSAM